MQQTLTSSHRHRRMTETNKRSLRPLVIVIILINLLISGCWLAVPRFMYGESEEFLGERFQHPLLSLLLPYFNISALIFFLMTWIFWKGSARLLWLPIVLHACLSLYFIWAALFVFSINWQQGIQTLFITTLPPLLVVILSIVEFRRRSQNEKSLVSV